ncbi:hypothetical protein [Rhizobium sp. TRM95796]|uniref:hypothetical protein n=1 Tax=Rhizobium sp. TRM95796 TaxID=2979862 RepID=UPI0021E892C0|nr:hypothetical protein [Rhizobium sp. TRM95796]MCV3765609.1 hypothetical protein [Rhizobium sp. TRM95796]
MREMAAHRATITISDETYANARRIAERDDVSVDALVESLVKRHAEYIDALNHPSEQNSIRLDDYEMQRDPDESDADFEVRLALFR